MRVTKKPDFAKTIAFFESINRYDPLPVLNVYGKKGVLALSAATPVDTGKASSSWGYKIEGNRDRYKLIWTNTDVAGSVPLVLLLQYGHSTKSGYYIQGRDFINPALKPVYDGLLKAIIRELNL